MIIFRIVQDVSCVRSFLDVDSLFFRVMFYKSSVICMNQWLCDSVEIRSGSSHLNQKKIDWHTKRPVIKKRFELITKKNHTAKQTKQKKISNNNNIVNWEKRTEKIDITFDTNKMCVCVSIWLARKIRSFQEFHM